MRLILVFIFPFVLSSCLFGQNENSDTGEAPIILYEEKKKPEHVQEIRSTGGVILQIRDNNDAPIKTRSLSPKEIEDLKKTLPN